MLSAASAFVAVAIGFSGIKGMRDAHDALEDVVAYSRG
jgi:hypothetical protein